MSSGRLGPPSRAPSCRRRRKRRQPARTGQQVHRLADHRLLQRRPRPRGVRPGCRPGRRRRCRRCRCVAAVPPVPAAVGVAEPVQLHAQPDQVLQRGRVHLAGHDRGHRRVAGHRGGGVAVQPRPAVPAARRRGGPVPGPLRADPGGPLLQQRRAAVQRQQVRQRDVHPGLDRLPGPLRQQARGDQPPHRLLQRVVVPLRVAAGRPPRRPGRTARPAPRSRPRRTPGVRSPPSTPAPLERGLQPHRPVLERLVLIAVRGHRAATGRRSPRPARSGPAGPSPPCAAVTRIASAASRQSSGQLVRSTGRSSGRTDSDISPAASAAATCGCAAARRTHAV